MLAHDLSGVFDSWLQLALSPAHFIGAAKTLLTPSKPTQLANNIATRKYPAKRRIEILWIG
mgnify:CR=1 FL=1|jgi:hypothetical protein